MTGCRTNEFSVQWDIFWDNEPRKQWHSRTASQRFYNFISSFPDLNKVKVARRRGALQPKFASFQPHLMLFLQWMELTTGICLSVVIFGQTQRRRRFFFLCCRTLVLLADWCYTCHRRMLNFIMTKSHNAQKKKRTYQPGTPVNIFKRISN